jgi:purine-binding chemotaxis protein CheW
MQTTDKYIEIGIGSEQHAIRIDFIYEIIKMQGITKLPMNDNVLLGVINLRGTIIPVISLRTRFNLPEQEYSKTTRIVVVSLEDRTVGLVVDSVKRVVTFSEIQPPGHIADVGTTSFIEGIGGDEDKLIMIMNLNSVLKPLFKELVH